MVTRNRQDKDILAFVVEEVIFAFGQGTVCLVRFCFVFGASQNPDKNLIDHSIITAFYLQYLFVKTLRSCFGANIQCTILSLCSCAAWGEDWLTVLLPL